jgi:hypothetical protein
VNPVAVRWARGHGEGKIIGGIVVLDGIVCKECREPLVYVQRWSGCFLVDVNHMRHLCRQTSIDYGGEYR